MQIQSPVREHLDGDITIEDVEMVNCLARPPRPCTLKAVPDDDDELDEQLDDEVDEDLDTRTTTTWGDEAGGVEAPRVLQSEVRRPLM